MCEKDIKTLMKINADDNLNLEDIPLVDVPSDILFPEELNQYLRGRIEYLIQTNAKLGQQLILKDEELEKYEVKTLNLKNKISEYETITEDLKGVAPTPTASKLMSQKIVELSKKLREKNCEFEVFKTQYNKLLQKVVDLENNRNKNVEIQKPDNQESKNTDLYNEQIKSLQDKLSVSNNKLFETKNINTQLKNDLKMANKILLQELGENFISIQNFTTNGNANGWRGRAQQIISLQQKNSELQERLSNMSDKETVVIKPDNRKQIIEQLNKDLTNVKKELEDTVKKLNSSRARTKVLETECQSLRTKNATQNEKIISNEQLIKMLTNQVSSLEEQQNYISKESQINCDFITKNYHTELAKERCKLENLNRTLEEKNNKIVELRNELSKFFDSAGNNTPRVLSPIFGKQNQEKLNGKINILEVEVKRLLELVEVLNSRLENERKDHTETQGVYRKERQRAAKLETKLLRLEMEMNVYKSQFYSKSGTKTNSQSSVTDNLSVESIKNSLELAEENIRALEMKMVILQREKEMDYQRFCGILNDTKNLMKQYDMV